MPVLIAAGPTDSIGFLDFAGELAERIAPEAAEAWALEAAGRAKAAPDAAPEIAPETGPEAGPATGA